MSIMHIPTDLYADLEHINTLIAERIRFRPEVERIAVPYTVRPASECVHAALVLLSAMPGSYSLESSAHAAAAVELIQAASSLHNNLSDGLMQSETTSSWQGNVGLMVGDYLYALAASEMALTPDARIIAYFSQSVMAICEGQMSPVQSVTPLSQALEQYRYAIGRTTAALCEAACMAGAVCGNLEARFVHLLGSYGYELGMALAIVRDVQALRSGQFAQPLTITLPLIYAADESYPLTTLLSNNTLTEEQGTAIMADALRYGGDTRALADAAIHVEKACATLTALPESPAREMLITMALSILQRV